MNLFLANGVLCVTLALTSLASQQRTPTSPQASTRLSPRITLAQPNEPGERLVVSGVVYKPDGITPAAGVILEIHHTDAEGWYHKASRNRENPRLQGTLQSDAQGQFEFSSIKPGKYPEGSNPAHVHFKATGGGFSEQFPTELYFAGDPHLPPANRVPRSGKWNAVCAPTRDAAGLLHCTYNIRLE